MIANLSLLRLAFFLIEKYIHRLTIMFITKNKKRQLNWYSFKFFEQNLVKSFIYTENGIKK